MHCKIMENAVENDPMMQLAKELSEKFLEVETDSDRTGEETEQLYQLLYEEYPIARGKAVSRKEREDNEYTSATLVYGEIDFVPFGQVISKFLAFDAIYYLFIP